MTDPNQVVSAVTLRDIYHVVQQTKETLDGLVERVDNVREDVKDHETRLRAIEGARVPAGFSKAVTSVLTLIVAALALGVSGYVAFIK